MHIWVVRSPVEFLGMAMKASHPFTVFHALPDVMLKVLFRTLTLGPYKIACNCIKTWSKWACELSDDEKALKRGMEPSVRSIMNDKRNHYRRA